MRIEEFWNKVYSGHNIIVVDTNEEHRFVSEVLRTRKPREVSLMTWSPESKFRDVKVADDLFGGCSLDEVHSDEDVVRHIQDVILKNEEASGIRVLLLRSLDIMPQGIGTRITNILKNNLQALTDRNVVVVIVTCNGGQVNDNIGHDYLYFPYDMMTPAEHETSTRNIIAGLKVNMENTANAQEKVAIGGKIKAFPTAYDVDYTSDEFGAVASALSGLTLQESRQGLFDSLKTYGKLDVKAIGTTKKNIVEKSGLLEWHDPVDPKNIGGMDNLKDWLKLRAIAITNKAASEYGLVPPKGLMLLGPPGTGKSLICKGIASMFGLPLVRLDIGKVMDRFVGGSEGKLRQALAIVEATSPVVVWMDEIDKSLSGTQSSSFTDSGTLSRVFGTLLTWIQENDTASFLVATCNAMLDNRKQLILPPELQRKGRFDAMVFVDIPTEKEARDILKIHIRMPRGQNKGRPIKGYDVNSLAAMEFDGGDQEKYRWTGAEYEASVLEAMYHGFSDGREYTTEDIRKALEGMIPQSFTMKETIGKLREFGHLKCMPASKDTRSREKKVSRESLDQKVEV